MLKETDLEKYFSGEISACEIKHRISEVGNTNLLVTGINTLLDMNRDKTLHLSDLIKVCDDFLLGNFTDRDVSGIAFFLEGSDHFEWDSSNTEGEIVADVIDHWSSPEINFPINKKNMTLTRSSLVKCTYDTSAFEKKV